MKNNNKFISYMIKLVRAQITLISVMLRYFVSCSVRNLRIFSNSGVRSASQVAPATSKFTMDSAQNFVVFMKLLGNLKHLPRKGWVMRGVKEPESVASHMYRMAMMSYALHPSETSMDMNKVMKMALVHDLAECLIGDITPFDGIDPKDKKRMEKDAMEKIAKLLGKNRNEVVQLFAEYEKQRSAEARFVKQLDILDMRLQAFEYEKKEGAPGKYQEFIDSTEGKFTHPDIIALANEVDKERALFSSVTDEMSDCDVADEKDSSVSPTANGVKST